METITIPFEFRVEGFEGMGKKMETSIVGLIGTPIRIHPFTPR